MTKLLVFAFILLSAPSSPAADFFVDAKAVPGGGGSADSPFQTISQAVAVAPNGGTITVKEGVYRESVSINKKMTADSPLTIRAADGARVIVTSFDALSGWKDEGNGLYSLTTPQRINDLYVAGVHQRLARFPDCQSPYAKIVATDATTGTVQLDQFPVLAPGEEKTLCLFVLCSASNTDQLYRLTSIAPATKSVSFKPDKWTFPKVGDPALLFNAASFIKYPGEWICEQIDDKTWKTIFRPQNPQALEKTETRNTDRPVVFDLSGASHVTLEGLEISGGSHRGIDASLTDNLQIKRCLIYDNGVGGINTSNCTDVLVDSCIVFANHHGILVGQGKNFTLLGSEIALNEEDGIDVAGLGLQDAKAPPCQNVVLKNDYIHGHIYLGHPDNTQSWGNVDGLTYENDLIMLGGNSSGQLEDCENLKVTDSAMVGSDNYHFNLGTARGMHTAVYNVEFTHDTLAFAGSVCIQMPKDVHDMKVFDNVFLQNRANYSGTNLSSGNNIYWAFGDPKNGIILSTVQGKWTEFTTVTDFTALNKDYEVSSQLANPQFKNVPKCLLRATGFTTPSNSITFLKDPGKTFAIGDLIEINGDGVQRKIETVDGQKITFNPPLPTAPFRDLVVWNWGSDSNFQIDLTSPVAGGKDQPGSNLNVAAYQRGELDGSGKRSIPELPPELKAVMPNPNDFIFPYYLYLKGRFD